jgi:hypothetical protein
LDADYDQRWVIIACRFTPGSSGAVAPGKTILQLPDATPIHSKERFKHYLENQKDYFLDE